MNKEQHLEFENIMTEFHKTHSLIKILRYILEYEDIEDIQELELNYLIEIIDENINKVYWDFDDIEHIILYENE